MDQIRHIPVLSENCQQALLEWQSTINKKKTFEEKKKEADDLFGKKNKLSNQTFREVRDALREMSPGKTCCIYCQTGELQAVEHFRPKAHYPEMAFDWNNYLYSCERCNREKLNKFCVLYSTNPIQEWYNLPDKEEVPLTVRSNPGALINPRTEDPLRLMTLDLTDTFIFLPRSKCTSNERYRVDYTIDLLGLNRRDYLVNAREQAFNSLCSHLSGCSSNIQDCKELIKKSTHTAVWREMKNQSESPGTKIRELFDRVPTARNW